MNLWDKFIKTINNPIIIAIGDIHGDFELLIDLLKKDSLIKENITANYGYEWIAENTILVQTGDQIDRAGRGSIHEDEDSDINILKLMTDLHKQALKKNSQVISLLGNHEIMNVFGVTNYISPMGFTDPERMYKFRPGNEHAKFLAQTRTTFVIIDDILFVHGGIINASMEKYGINNVNDLIFYDYLVRMYLNGEYVGITKIMDYVNGYDSILSNRFMTGHDQKNNVDLEDNIICANITEVSKKIGV